VRASHRGKVVQAADDVIGLVVNTAARATEAAAGGELVVTAPVLEGARNLTGVSFDGPHAGSFRGIQEQVQVYFASRDARPQPSSSNQPADETTPMSRGILHVSWRNR
jgi:class 3 adenylate cyclase